MIYISLFIEFIKIGLFTFGGGYGAIPLIHEVVIRNCWMDEEMFANMIAISESTPGPIMVNAATYIGSKEGGILGSFFATLGVVTPSFIIIILISVLLKKVLGNIFVQGAIEGIKLSLMGMILATGIYMLITNILPQGSISIPAILVSIILGAIIIVYKRIRKKELSPILLIIISAFLGILIL